MKSPRGIRSFSWHIFVFLGFSSLVVSVASGQFETVINVPPDAVPSSLGSDTQLNLFAQGSLPLLFQAGPADNSGTNIEVNVLGGTIGEKFNAYSGSTVNLESGSIGNDFHALSGSVVSIHGGVVGDHFYAAGATVTISDGTVGDFVRVYVGGHVTIDGGVIGDRVDVFNGSELNVAGGSVGSLLDAHAFSTVNLSGGSIASNFDALKGSTVRISGGTVGPQFIAHGGSQIEISGGHIEGRFRALSDSSVRILGGEFYLDDMPISGLENFGDRAAVNLPTDSILSGILADGTHFAFSSHNNDRISDGVLSLEVAELPPIELSTIVASTDPVPIGIRRGQTLLVDDGATVQDNIRAGPGAVVQVESGGRVGRNLTAVGAEVTILGGYVGQFFKALGSTVRITGGEVENNFRSQNSEVTITGGQIGSDFAAIDSTVAISGGSIGDLFYAAEGSSVTVSGGQIGSGFAALDGSEVILSGGGIDHGFHAQSGSMVTMLGGEFRLDGVLVGELNMPGDRVNVSVPDRSSLTGVFADGTPFVFSHHDSLAEGEIILEAVELPPINTTLIIASIDDVPTGLRHGQTLRVDNGSVIGNGFNAGWRSTVEVEAGGSVGRWFEAAGAEVNVAGTIGQSFRALNSTLNVDGGEVGDDFVATASIVAVLDGEIGDRFHARDGTQVTITGGSIRGFHAQDSTVTMSGGTVGAGFRIDNSVVSIQGGTVGQFFQAENSSQVTLMGGFIDTGFQVRGGSTVAITGRHFWLDGQAINGLDEPGSRLTLRPDSESTLTGTFADGTPFVFASQRGDILGGVEITLESSDLPPVETTMITASVDPIPITIREGQTLVVDEGGVVPRRFRAGRGSTVVVESGGIIENGAEAIGATVTVLAEGGIGEDVGRAFRAFAGSEVTIAGGRVGRDFYVENSDVTMTSGAIGRDFEATRKSHVRILGGRIDDVASFINGSSLTLSDGTIGDDSKIDGAQAEINGGSVGQFFRVRGGSNVTISGGAVGDGFRATDSVVTLADGRFGQFFRAGNGSHVTITGGQFGQYFTAEAGSSVMISGGTFGPEFVAEQDSQVSLMGGSVGDQTRAENGSHVVISGGTIGEKFHADRSSNVSLVGGEFRLDGTVIAGLENEGDQITLGLGLGVLSGTLADGTPFAFSRDDGDTLPLRTLVLESAALPPIGPDSIVASMDTVPLGIRMGQTLQADKGSRIPDHFNAGSGSTVQIEPGAVVGRNLEAVGAEVHVFGGSVREGFDAFGGSVVTISGGTIGDTFAAYAGSEIHIQGTEFFFDGSNIEGLVVPGDSIVLEQRDANLTGRLLDGNLFHFELNGSLTLPRDYFHPAATVRLTLGAPATRECDFDDDMTCELADIDSLMLALGGNDDKFDLNGSGTVDRDDVEVWLASAGQKSLGRPYVFGDATLDGAVDQADLNVIGRHWQSAATGWSQGDFNGDGQVDAIDLDEIGNHWLSSPVETPSVPEPPGFALSLLGLALLRSFRSRQRSAAGRRWVRLST